MFKRKEFKEDPQHGYKAVKDMGPGELGRALKLVSTRVDGNDLLIDIKKVQVLEICYGYAEWEDKRLVQVTFRLKGSKDEYRVTVGINGLYEFETSKY